MQCGTESHNSLCLVIPEAARGVGRVWLSGIHNHQRSKYGKTGVMDSGLAPLARPE
jgi:hypothetical protein